ncbi:MAG: hypothetical protein Ct9H90mP7_2140 [Candidatus Neomarinimicrobiota bacterium]|nr:MAG: hypothetical protein Ct9H90mP7_2140 [Candidatus Neomarinimicrobiota bacterium]
MVAPNHQKLWIHDTRTSQIEEWDESKMLENEKEVLGMYLSGHPLLKYADDLEEYSNFDFTDKINYATKIR